MRAPNQTLGENDSYLSGNADLSFGGTCTSASGGTLAFTLYEVEIDGTIYLKLFSSDVYWLQVGTGGTDHLEMTVNLAFNPPDDEQVTSGLFTVRSQEALDVFEWDYHNRMTSVTRYLANATGDSQVFASPSGANVTLSEAYTKHYVYNVYDQLIYEYRVDADTPAVKDNETDYIVQGGQRVAVLEKTAGSYDVTHLLLPDPTSNRMLAEQYINGATSHTIWPLHDQQGTVIAAISDDWHDDQDDVQHFEYDAYGLLKFDTEQDPSLANRLVSLHAGRDWDEVSDLYYNNARWYDPSMQRFISQDPLGFAGGDTNLYRYCGNSPTNATDPSGFVIETGWDIFSVVVGIGSVGLDIYNIATTGEGWGDLGLDLFGLGVDVGAAFVPFVPGGMSVAMKARRAYRIADTAIDIGRKIDTGINAYQAVQSGIASYDAYQRGDYWNMAISGVGAGLGGLHFGIRGVQGVKHFRENFEIVGLPNARSFATSPSSGGLGGWTDMRIRRRINASHDLGVDLSISRPTILDNARLTAAERTVVEKHFRIKMRSLQSAARRAELTFSPGTDAVRISELQAAYRTRVIERFESMFGTSPNMARLDADHPIDLIVGGAADQRLKMIHRSINRSIGSSLRNAAERAGLEPGDLIRSINVDGGF